MDVDTKAVLDISPKRSCLVCGDIASGFHYGVASCEACKAFFKRTIQGNIEYTCPAQSECEINKRRRKACQACRFQKCLRMGMLKEGVRLDRVRGGRQKYRRSAESPYPLQSITQKKTSIEENKMITALILCEPEPMTVNDSSSKERWTTYSKSPVDKTVCILSDLVDRELVSTIVWAKQIPGFADLKLNDQMRLLQNTWAEILSLSLAYRTHQQLSSSSPYSLSSEPSKLLFASDFTMTESEAAEVNADQMYSYCVELVRRLNHLRLAREEYLILKALLLTNDDIALEDTSSVQKLRDNLVYTLQECVTALRPFNCVQHVCQMLLCLPLLRQVDGVIRQFWNGVKREGRIQMNKLFVEMLESNHLR